jgi:catechol 2,3-dioxygenase-like lactoylglutathione lyase family enzyme
MLKRIHSILFYASDLAQTEAFYRRLGFTAELVGNTLRVELAGFKLAFIDENETPIKNDTGVTPKGAGVFIYIEVDDVDSYYQQLQELGVRTSSEPRTWPWGKREFAVKDPDGYKLIFFTPAS